MLARVSLRILLVQLASDVLIILLPFSKSINGDHRVLVGLLQMDKGIKGRIPKHSVSGWRLDDEKAQESCAHNLCDDLSLSVFCSIECSLH